jgi:hypothetical protein
LAGHLTIRRAIAIKPCERELTDFSPRAPAGINYISEGRAAAQACEVSEDGIRYMSMWRYARRQAEAVCVQADFTDSLGWGRTT